MSLKVALELRLGRRLTRLGAGNRGSEAAAGGVSPRYGDLGITVACGDLGWAELNVPIVARRPQSELIANVCVALVIAMDATAGSRWGEARQLAAGGRWLR